MSPRGCRVKRDKRRSLYDVKISGSGPLPQSTQPNLALFPHVAVDFGNHRTQANQKIGGARRDRTDDILLAKQALSQLSYGPISWQPSSSEDDLVGPGGLEPPTSRLSGVRSNHLSYGPPDSVRIAFACGKAPDELGVSQHTKNII